MKTGIHEKHAGEYDDGFSRNPFAYASELQAVRMLLPREGTGVEIGVGTRRFAGELGIPGGMDAGDPVREGHGEGCFVVVRADK